MKKLSSWGSSSLQNFLAFFAALGFLFLGTVVKAQQNPLEKIMALELPKIKAIREKEAQHELQLLLVTIEYDKKGQAHFSSHHYHQQDSTYFYPASTVKLPIAVLALEKIKRLQEQGIAISKDTPFHLIDPQTKQPLQQKDSTHPKKQLTIGHLIKKIFLVSDNDAYNILFDFLGKKAINEGLAARGIQHTAIRHKFLFGADNENSWEYVFLDKKDTLYHQKSLFSPALPLLPLKAQQKGKAHWSKGKKIASPMDFSQKNWMALSAQIELLKRLVFPQQFSFNERFDLTDEDLEFLRFWMSRTTLETTIAEYKTSEYYDSYGKFFIYGDTKGEMTDKLRIYNKVGYAYGTLTDVAYIEDKQNKLAFFLAGTLLVNENQTFNDDTYEFEEKGIPFLAEVGRQVYLSLINKE